MKLRQVQLHGFKSFRAKSGIEVGDGISAVVGPNGCGKSNIVDAIRWAMGTQSARSLRGAEMADVIFAGSRTRKPAGFAEVTLTFENDETRMVSSDDLARSPVRAMAESASTLTVARRLHRSGESEYLINGVKVRLKDVHELFLGTGASVRGYSIIEQGQIEFLVNARPSERRAFVEELAGVTRYRYHRQETERKLDTTRANLERLEDLLAEVKRRMDQLKRQARQAERHASMSARKRDLEIGLLLVAWERERARSIEVGEQLGATRARWEAATAGLADSEAVESTIDVARHDCEETHRAVTETVFRLRTKRDLLRQSVTHAQQTRERLLGERSRFDADERELTDELAELARQAAQLEQRLAETRQLAPKTDISLRDAAEAAILALARTEAEVESLETQLRDVAQHLGHEGAMMKGRRDQQERLAARAAGWAERQAELTRERSARQVRLAAQREAEVASERDLEGSIAALQATESSATEAQAALERARHALDENARTRASSRARRDAMAESAAVEAGEGARLVREAAEKGQLPGVIGLVGDGIIAPSDREAPLHGVLRDLLEYVVVADADAAREVIRFAAGADAVVGCIEQRELPPAVPAPDGSLLAALQVADWVPESVRRVLGGAVTVASVLAETRAVEAGCRVDADGHCANAHGFWRSADPGGGVVARRARLLHELRQLDLSLGVLADQGRALTTAREQAESALGEARQRVVSARRALETARAQRAHLTAQRQRLEAEIESAATLLREHEAVQGADASHRAELEAAQLRSQTVIAELGRQMSQLETDRDEARAGRDQRRIERDRRQQAWAQAQAAQRQHQTDLERLEEGRRQVEQAVKRAQLRLEKLTARRRDIAEQLTRAQLEAETNQAGAAEVGRTLEVAETDAERASKRLETLRAQHQEQLGRLKRQRSQCAELRAELDRLALCLEQAKHEQEHQQDALLQRHGLAIDRARLQLGDFELPDEARDLAGDLARDLERLGPINHAALEELEEARTRHDFLCDQQADLLAAIDDMRLTIDELDHASRTQFMQTFVALREEFEILFTRLFRGGEATLELCGESDPLEAGVEVTVRPPGKNVRSMTLLSGGEKALTAVALVFAAFRLKPSPFCVLDEVDAPLDDENVDRFVSLIDELSDETQFLVITHNRRTMEGAHKLVGVTMEEPGSSKLVAVNMPRPQAAERPAAVAS